MVSQYNPPSPQSMSRMGDWTVPSAPPSTHTTHTTHTIPSAGSSITDPTLTMSPLFPPSLPQIICHIHSPCGPTPPPILPLLLHAPHPAHPPLPPYLPLHPPSSILHPPLSDGAVPLRSPPVHTSSSSPHPPFSLSPSHSPPPPLCVPQHPPPSHWWMAWLGTPLPRPSPSPPSPAHPVPPILACLLAAAAAGGGGTRTHGLWIFPLFLDTPQSPSASTNIRCESLGPTPRRARPTRHPEQTAGQARLNVGSATTDRVVSETPRRSLTTRIALTRNQYLFPRFLIFALQLGFQYFLPFFSFFLAHPIAHN